MFVSNDDSLKCVIGRERSSLFSTIIYLAEIMLWNAAIARNNKIKRGIYAYSEEDEGIDKINSRFEITTKKNHQKVGEWRK